ncbi:MAG: winged helix-turn-helix domain-containing protein [Planctomycetaceae bacterium]
MKTTTLRSDSSAGCVAPRVKLWLELDGQRVFCPGMCQILQAVDETGSIKEAAAAVERSYRFIWGRLKEAERALGKPLVETRVGGELAQRSSLTPLGRELLSAFVSLRRRIFELVDDEFARSFKSLKPAPAHRRRVAAK